MAMAHTMSLCQQSSFSADNTLITVIPAFSHKGPLPLLSCPSAQSVGPFVAGMPTQVPLWMAKHLHQTHLAQLVIPEWLSVDGLTAILREEQTSAMLTSELPYHYYEIARSLSSVLAASTSGGGGSGSGANANANSGSGGGTGAHSRAALVVLQDLVSVRVDKIRQNFHALSKDTLQPMAVVNDELPMIAVTGICSVELSKIGPFLQRAFSDYGRLLKDAAKEEEHDDEVGVGGGVEKGVGVGVGMGVEKGVGVREGGEKATASDKLAAAAASSSTQESVQKVAMARSRLRRFRQ